MRKSFTLLVLFGVVGMGVYALAKDKTTFSTSASRGLVADCNFLIKDYDHIEYEVDKIEQELVKFKDQNRISTRRADSNRAFEWAKKSLYALEGHLRKIKNKYEDIKFQFNKIEMTAELKVLSEKIDQKHYLLRNHILALKTLVASFQNKVQAGLN